MGYTGLPPRSPLHPPLIEQVSKRRSFCFLHTYEATGRYWHGLEKAGLLRSGTGVRLVHSPWGEDARRFNAVARTDGELHQIVEQHRLPFIIDRVVGGSPYHDYEFDRDLIEDYARLLGEDFLGGQIHETVCNVQNDWDRFAAASKELETSPIRPDDLRSFFTWENAERWLECGSLDDYAGRPRPRHGDEFWREVEWVARRQATRFADRFSYCEGSRVGEHVWHAFYKLGAGTCLAQVGPWASAQTQFAIASLRGAARAAGRPWGAFFAPWGPYGCTAFAPETDWSWQAPKKNMDASGFPAGPHLGPSSALQRRSFFHTYLSGAWTLHEEWGAECNLSDWEEGEISSYGRVTRDLLDFQEAVPDVGEPYTPLALVLDARLPMLDVATWARIKAGIFSHGPADSANASRKDSGSNEVNCYAPCAVPEVFDIVPSDASQAVWNRYKEIIAIGTSSAPPCAYRYSDDDLLNQILRAANELSPFERTTHLPMQINYRKSDGAWIAGLYNPWGTVRGDIVEVGSVLNLDCTIHDLLRPKFALRSAQVLHAWPYNSSVTLRGGALEVAVGPGGTLIVEVLPV